LGSWSRRRSSADTLALEERASVSVQVGSADTLVIGTDEGDKVIAEIVGGRDKGRPVRQT
jgi:hypothetical protein